jgi:hypothetical protein
MICCAGPILDRRIAIEKQVRRIEWRFDAWPATGLIVYMEWYSIDRNVSVVDRGTVTKQDAVRIIDDYFARLRPHYYYGEDGLAETMFGFQKSKDEFIEICISPEEISFKYEISFPRKILFLSFPKVIQVEKTLHSKEELKVAVFSFYDLDSESYRCYLDQ